MAEKLESMEDAVIAVAISLGFLSLTKQIFKFLNWVWIMFLRPAKNLKESYGLWAIITGATDGIGKALAFELASKGHNLILVGRNPSKLEATRNEILAKNGEKQQLQIKTSEIDLAKCSGEEITRKIEEAIEGLDIGILINNAGLAYPYARYFHEVDFELMESIIKVNTEGITWITKAVISLMLKKKKGVIVNIGSGSSVVIPSYPLNAIYASTKAYVAMFSKCMNGEYKHQGIDIQCQLKDQPLWLLVLFSLGSLSLLKCSFAVLKWVFVNFLRPAKNLKKYGSWALVTGPTDGIGKGFAFQLARKGLNLVLVGRNPDKLKEVSDSILSKHNKLKIKTVIVDFSDDIDEGVRRIKETIEELDVGLLINNVGVSYPYARFFHEVDEELLKNLIKVNVESTTKVTQAVLPGMLKRKKGAIVNIGSGAAIVIPSDPLYAVYAATKAYIDQLSRCLYVEYKKSGIDVQCQVPLYVATKMASIKRSSFFVPSSEGYARAGLRWIGYEPRCTPYWPHSLLWGLVSALPESMVDAWRFRFCLAIRKKGQLKDSRKKE